MMFQIGLCFLCVCNALAFEVLESLGKQDSDVFTKLAERINGMQAKIARLELSKTRLHQKITQLEERLEAYELNTASEKDITVESDEDSEIIVRRGVLDLTEDDDQVPLTISKRQNVTQQHVAFTLYLDHTLTNLGGNQPIVYNKAILNDGNGYSNRSGIFRVPVTGVYLFSWSATAKKVPTGNAYEAWSRLYVNGKVQLDAVAESRIDTYDSQGSSTVVIHCEQGWEVWTSHYGAFPDLFGSDVLRTTSFMGVLLYETQ
ncbi:Complement C1q-like protein 4 [Mactra antiquata]